MNAVAVIPARHASSRLPGKALLEIAGRTMIEHVYRRASGAGSIREVLVATDDRRILEEVERFGGRAVLTRPDHPSGTDRIAEVARGLDAEIIVNVQGDEPLLEPSEIDLVVAPFASEPALGMTTLATPIQDPVDMEDPAAVKVVTDLAGNALYFSRQPIPGYRGQPVGERLKHIGLYAYRREFLLRYAALPPSPLELAERLEQLRALEHGHRIRVVRTPRDAIGVDTPEDLERVRRLFREREQR